MTLAIDLLLAALALALALFSALWLLSVIRSDASIVDLFWGVGFVVLAWFYEWMAGGGGIRGTLGLALVSVWGLRLSLHLTRRNLGAPEDYRYREMREARGSSFWWISLFSVFWLQAAILWVVSFPVAHMQRADVPMGWLGWFAILVSVVGFLFEAVGDHQLTRFKADPKNRGQVLDQGLWRYTRHPNYFGDAMFWWGLGLLAMEVPGWWWTVTGPILMTVLLMRVSGVTLLEKRLVETKPAYADYVRRTNAFFPAPPRSEEAPPNDGRGPRRTGEDPSSTSPSELA